MPLPKNYPRSSASAKAALPPGKTKCDGGPVVQVLANRYRMGNKLGSGAFGCAYLVTDLKANNERKVLKQIVVAELQPDETVDAVREARLLAKLDHPSIVKFHDSFMERDFFCIVTEYCEGGDLDEKICQWRDSGKTFEHSLIIDWFIQLTTAIRYIHDRRILHRDLKTRNIFLKNNLIKLGDFGISRILMGTSDLATTFTGTPYYMSPEVLKHDGYNVKSDIWSLGVVLYELCTLQHAFQGQNLMAVMYKIVEGEQPRLPDHFEPQLRSLFIRMLDKEPVHRPTAIEILQESFIQDHLQKLRGKIQVQRQVSSSKVAEEAEAIARALSPVKKKRLMQDSNRAMTPREKMELRKRQIADEEAEERKRIATKNFSEGRKRFKEQQKKQARVVPPWVEEHPDVFTDPDFSLTQLDSTAHLSGSTASAMDVSLNTHGVVSGNGLEMTDDNSMTMSMLESEVEIPEDPWLAETHYSQYDDFETDESSQSDSDADGEYEALLGCIEDALDLPNNQSAPVEPAEEPSHDELSPFTPLARERRISLLKAQCQQVFSPESFQRVYEYLKAARSSTGLVDEAAVIEGLGRIVSNVRDCFLVDQIVFLEKQAESGFAFT